MVGMLDGIIHHTVIYVPMVIAHYIIYAHMHGVVMHGETCPMPRLTVTVVKVLRYGVVHVRQRMVIDVATEDDRCVTVLPHIAVNHPCLGCPFRCRMGKFESKSFESSLIPFRFVPP